ncbi:5-oxoprolinase subunit B family protein [Pseudonocardia spinosispora]|uniref:5-oxoprolinase subunit B family protein n=1 Tax=Pseudonocardia spinosispora TaxID=103441 RepID=UPI00042A6007|nr:carboxyltransferase domain-containing protein [Pseudonocardia spinosispora]
MSAPTRTDLQPDENGVLYSHGGDEWIVAQLAESMSLNAHLRAQAITRRLTELKLPGVLEICPANAAYMLRVDPDVAHPRAIVERLRELADEVGDAEDFVLQTRIVDLPVLFRDEWTHAALMRFRDRHQTPDRTDLEFAAELNGYSTVDEFIAAIVGTPFIVSMIGFVPAVPWGYQLVPQERQIEVPKYVRPRTFTPERALGWGGGFTAIYPVDGAGGYQLFGICPGPMVDPAQRLHDFADGFTFPRPGDLFRYRQIDRAEYDAIRKTVDDGSFRYRIREVEFVPSDWFADPEATVRRLEGALDAA